MGRSTLKFCLSLVATDEEREDRLGDLLESFAHDIRTLGDGEARRRHRRHVLTSIISIAGRRFGGFLQNEVPTAAAAVLIALSGYGSLVRATAETWWMKSGFDRNPGYFVADNSIDYPVCGAIPAAGGHVTEARSRVVVIPRGARVTGISCGKPVSAAWLSDNDYTRGRVLAVADTGEPMRFSVMWEEK